MTVSCHEAMVGAQTSDRIVAPASGASAATIESLRARLLSERAVSKEARQQAQNIAQKVSELQTRLNAEIECRKKAEAAMNEVLEVLKVKGFSMEQVMAKTYMPSESSASEEAAPIRSSKHGESDQSSGEEAFQVRMKDKHQDSANSQGNVDNAVLTGDSVFEHREGCISEDSSSDKTQIHSEDTSGSDTSEVEKEVVNKDEDRSNHEQAVLIDPSNAHHNVSLVSSERGEEGGIEQSSKLLSNLVKPVEGEVNTKSNGEAGLPSANDLPNLQLANQFSGCQSGDSLATSSECLSTGQQVDGHSNGAMHPNNVKKLNYSLFRVTESFQGPRPKDVHSYTINSGYSYDLPHMYAGKVHNLSSAEAPLSRGLKSYSNTAYQTQEQLSFEVAEFGRCLQAPIRDAILSLVDDKRGKLGSILMALHLAKQELKDQEQASSYTEEKFEAPLPTPYDRSVYPGYYEGVPYQPPYHPWKHEQRNEAPIIHFPMSPTSDHEVSPFERHEELRRSRSTSTYYMPDYDPYLQPKGELHLGNGITLYTD